jgi:hypothetical protein
MQSIIKGGGGTASKVKTPKFPSPKQYFGNPVLKKGNVVIPEYSPNEWKKMQITRDAINSAIKVSMSANQRPPKRGGKTRKNRRARKTQRRRKHSSKHR